MRPGNAPHRELRVVGNRRADADDDGIHKRAQPMKMIKPIGAVDVMGMPGRGRCTSVERLPDLADDEEIVDRLAASGAKISFHRSAETP